MLRPQRKSTTEHQTSKESHRRQTPIESRKIHQRHISTRSRMMLAAPSKWGLDEKNIIPSLKSCCCLIFLCKTQTLKRLEKTSNNERGALPLARAKIHHAHIALRRHEARQIRGGADRRRLEELSPTRNHGLCIASRKRPTSIALSSSAGCWAAPLNFPSERRIGRSSLARSKDASLPH